MHLSLSVKCLECRCSPRETERARAKTSERRAHLLWLGPKYGRARESRESSAGAAHGIRGPISRAKGVIPRGTVALPPQCAWIFTARCFFRFTGKTPNKNKRKEEKSQCLADEKCRKEVIIEKFVQ